MYMLKSLCSIVVLGRFSRIGDAKDKLTKLYNGKKFGGMDMEIPCPSFTKGYVTIIKRIWI
jgi:hypothetical protein